MPPTVDATDDRPGVDPADSRDGRPVVDADHASRPSRLPAPIRRWGARVVIVVALASTLLWVGAIAYGTWGDPHLAGWLEDRTFPTAAEPICETAMAEVAAFPQAFEATSPTERAGVIRQTTARLATMLDDLRAVVPDTADAEWIGMWLDDWGVHLDDRLDFARRLDANGAEEEFFESTKANTQISKSLNAFAEINKMPSCATPGDV